MKNPGIHPINPCINQGYIDVGDKRVLVTLSWWQFLDVSDRILILVTSFGRWWSTLMLKDRGYWLQKWPKPSPTSQSCLYLISSPTPVTNIDVAFGNTRLIGILLLPNRSFHLALCSIPGQIIGTSVYFFFLRLPYCPDIVYFIGYVKMVYCGSVRIKLGVYTSGIFCFELPKWIKWNKKLLFIK